MTRQRRLSEEQTQEIARVATREALRRYQPVEDPEGRLTLGISLEGDVYRYCLYLAGERPEDAVFLTQADVNRTTGEVEVQVFLEPRDIQ